jgi:peroxin-19
MASLDEQAKLDAALDAALDDLDSDDEEPESAERSSSIPAATPPPVMMGPPRPPVVESENGSMPDDWSPEKLFATMMQHMIEGGEGGGGDGSSSTEDEFIGRLMQEMQTQLQSDLGAPPTMETEPTTVTSGTNNANQTATPTATTTSSASSKTKRSRSVKASPSGGKEEIEAAISNLVQDLAKQATMNDDVGNASSLPDSDTDMLNSIMEGLAGIGGGQADGDDGFNPDAVIDGMMEQLLSKDLMYEPMKQVATKFPCWLEERQSTLSPKEYAEYVQ